MIKPKKLKGTLDAYNYLIELFKFDMIEAADFQYYFNCFFLQHSLNYENNAEELISKLFWAVEDYVAEPLLRNNNSLSTIRDLDDEDLKSCALEMQKEIENFTNLRYDVNSCDVNKSIVSFEGTLKNYEKFLKDIAESSWPEKLESKIIMFLFFYGEQAVPIEEKFWKNIIEFVGSLEYYDEWNISPEEVPVIQKLARRTLAHIWLAE